MKNFLFYRTIILFCIVSTILLTAQTPGYASGFAVERYAVIVQNIGAGLAKSYRNLLIDQGEVDVSNILCYGSDKPFVDVCIGEPTAKDVSAGFSELAGQVSDGDTLFVLFACHMQKGYLINNSLAYDELNVLLSAFPESVTVIVIIEGCHSAAAIPFLDAADLVYASAGPDEPCYGGWMHFFLDALIQDSVSNEADIDGNGYVSFGEAYDYAADEERLMEWYANLSRDVWPPEDFHPTPFRTDWEFQYDFFMEKWGQSPIFKGYY